MTDYLIPEDESKALEMFWDMKRKFGWAGTFMMRADFEYFIGRVLTEDEWNNVRIQKMWNDIIPSLMAEQANEVICDIIRELDLPEVDE